MGNHDKGQEQYPLCLPGREDITLLKSVISGANMLGSKPSSKDFGKFLNFFVPQFSHL